MIVRALKEDDKKNSSKFSYIFNLVLRSFMIASVIFFAVVLIFTFVCMGDSYYNLKSGEKSNPLFGAYVIVSESMVPTIMVNDAIVVKRVDDDNLKIGDIITFNSTDRIYKGLTITHRIVGIQKTKDGSNIYRTKGDNNVLADTALVDLDSIYGKVILKIPKIGYLQQFVSSTAGFIVAIVVPIFIVIIYEVLRIKKLIKQQDDEIEII